MTNQKPAGHQGLLQIKRMVDLIMKVNCQNYALISEVAKEMGMKKTAVMQFIDDNPKLFKLIEVKKGDKVQGLGIKVVYESPEQNPETEEWLEKQKALWEKKIHISSQYYYNQLEFHHITVDSSEGKKNLYRNTPEKIQELVDIAERIEERIGRELEIISGGATSSLMRVLDGNLPERVNMLRVGEGILLAYDLPHLYGYEMDDMYQDAFVLRTEVIEVKDKPSHPVGEIGFDAFGHRIQYEDRGIRRRALVGIGKCDYGDPSELLCREPGAEVLGASSDHTILDVQDVKRSLKVGDIIEFDIKYATLVYLTNSPNIEKVYI